jgi:hypothetical protein
VDIIDNHKLIVPLKVVGTEIIYYVKNEEQYDYEIMHEAHIKTGRGGRNYICCQTFQFSKHLGLLNIGNNISII